MKQTIYNFDKIIQKILKHLPKAKNNIKFLLEQDFTIEMSNSEHILMLLSYLNTESTINCKQLVDLCGIDYLYYGKTEENHEIVTNNTFTDENNKQFFNIKESINQTRFAVIYNLLSHSNNLRIRIKCFLQDNSLIIPSCTKIWPAANWYEREVFDLFGIIFTDHPNLKKILTEEELNGYPLRKDFPVSGNFEVRFEAKTQQIRSDPIDLEPYNVIPKVIR